MYLVGHEVPPPYAREMAALLATGGTAVVALSHRSAAALWNLSPYPAPGDVCVTVRPGRSADRSGIETHHAALHRRDVRRRHGMPLTSPPRTILDQAARLPAELRTAAALGPRWLTELERLVAEAEYRGLATEVELRDQLERNPNKPGVCALRAVLDLPGGPRRTRSPGERAMLALLRAHDVDGYETNAKVAGHEVDFLWRDLGFAVEVDGYDAHSGRVAFERDRLKAAVLNANGIAVMPVTGRQVRADPHNVIARLVAALAARLTRVNRGARGPAG